MDPTNDSQNKSQSTTDSSKPNQSQNDKKPTSFAPNPGNKFGLFISSVSPGSMINLFTLILIIAAIPLTVFIAQKQQDIRQQASVDNVYITTTPETTSIGGNVTISASGPRSCLGEITVPNFSPQPALSCSMPSRNCSSSTSCVVTWTCAIQDAGNYIININKCNGSAKLNVLQ